MKRVLYLDPDDDRRETVTTGLRRARDEFEVVPGPPDGESLERLDDEAFDCILVDRAAWEADDRRTVEAVEATFPDLPVVVVEGENPVALDGGRDGVEDRFPRWAASKGRFDVLAGRIDRAVEGEAPENGAHGVLESVIHNSADAVGVLDDEYRFDHVSPAIERVLGRSAADLEGEDALGYVHPDDREVVEEAFGTLLDRPGEPLVAELRMATVEGGWAWVEGRVVPVPCDGDGDRDRIVLFAREPPDGSARERRIEAMVKHSSDVITIVDADGVVSYESAAARRVKGVDPEDLVGREIWAFVHPDDRARVEAKLREVVDRPGGVVGPVEYRFRDRNGEWQWVESVGSNPGPDAPIEGYVVNTRNVTDRVDRENQLRVLDRVLRHNVRNDLEVVMGHAERIAEYEDDSTDLERACETVLDRCRSLLGTLDKEREIVELLVQPPDTLRIDLSKAVRDAVEDVRADYPGAEVVLDCPADVRARAVPDFGRAVEELLENAIVHGGAAAEPIRVTVERENGVAVVTVADEGAGIPDDEVRVLLDAYEIDQLYHGSGMGLWLVHWIVRASDGELAFESSDPRGNVVTITLDLADGSGRSDSGNGAG